MPTENCPWIVSLSPRIYRAYNCQSAIKQDVGWATYTHRVDHEGLSQTELHLLSLRWPSSCLQDPSRLVASETVGPTISPSPQSCRCFQASTILFVGWVVLAWSRWMPPGGLAKTCPEAPMLKDTRLCLLKMHPSHWVWDDLEFSLQMEYLFPIPLTPIFYFHRSSVCWEDRLECEGSILEYSVNCST